MTDEEKAEEYVDKIKRQYLLSEEGLGCAEQGYLDGLEESRKESCEVCEKESNKEYQKLFDKQREIIEELEKENEELKEDVLEKQDLINDYVMDNAKLEKENEELKAQFEKEHNLLSDIIESFTSQSLTDDFEMANTAREIAEILEIKNYR